MKEKKNKSWATVGREENASLRGGGTQTGSTQREEPKPSSSTHMHMHKACIHPTGVAALLLLLLFLSPCRSVTMLSNETVISRLDAPFGAVMDASRKSLFIAECGGCAVLRVLVKSPYTMTTYAGTRGNCSRSSVVDGDAKSVARFGCVLDIIVWDASNRLYVGDNGNHAIRMVSSGDKGAVSVVNTVVTTSAGVYFMTRYGNDAIVFTAASKIVYMFTISNGIVSTIANLPETVFGITADPTYLYAASGSSGQIFRFTPEGSVSTLASIGGGHGGLAFLPAPSADMLVVTAIGGGGSLSFASTPNGTVSGPVTGSNVVGNSLGIAPWTAATWFVTDRDAGRLLKLDVDLPFIPVRSVRSVSPSESMINNVETTSVIATSSLRISRSTSASLPSTFSSLQTTTTTTTTNGHTAITPSYYSSSTTVQKIEVGAHQPDDVDASSTLTTAAAAVSVSVSSAAMLVAGGDLSLLDVTTFAAIQSARCSDILRRPSDGSSSSSPLKYLLSPFSDFGASIASLGNVGAMMVVVAAHSAAVGIAKCRRQVKLKTAMAKVFYPGVSLTVASVLIPGAVRSAIIGLQSPTTTTTRSPSLAEQVGSCVVTGVAVAGMIWIWRHAVLHWCTGASVVYRNAPVPWVRRATASAAVPPFISSVLLPRGQWTPTATQRRVGVVFATVTGQQYRWLPGGLLLLTVVSAAVSGAPVGADDAAGCSALYAVLAALSCVPAVLVVRLGGPYRIRAMNGFTVANSMITAIAAAITAVALQNLSDADVYVRVIDALGTALYVSSAMRSVLLVGLRVASRMLAPSEKRTTARSGSGLHDESFVEPLKRSRRSGTINAPQGTPSDGGSSRVVAGFMMEFTASDASLPSRYQSHHDRNHDLEPLAELVALACLRRRAGECVPQRVSLHTFH